MTKELTPLDLLKSLNRNINIAHYLNGAEKKALRDMLNAEKEAEVKPKPKPVKAAPKSNASVEGSDA